jgi:hypothetical protein
MTRLVPASLVLGVLMLGRPAAAAEILPHSSIAEVTVEMLLVEGGERQALLRGASGEQVVVRSGDTIGQEQAVVVEVGKAGVLVEQRLGGEQGRGVRLRQHLPLSHGLIEIQSER